MKFIILKLKQNIVPYIFCLFLFFLILFSNQNIYASKNGLFIWANYLVPSLLPFFIATELLNHTNIPELLGKWCGKFIKPLFNIPGEGRICIYNGNHMWLPYWCQNCV